MQRVVLDGAFHRSGVSHEFGAVQDLDGFLSRQPVSDQFSPARKSKHEMRLDETQGEVNVGGNESFVNVNWRARSSGAEMAMRRQIPSIVVLDSIRRGYFA